MEPDAGSIERKVIPASEILEKIENGEPVDYDGVTIVGDLDLRKLNLPTEYIEIMEYVFGSPYLTVEAKLVASSISISNSEIKGDVNFGNTIFQEPVNFMRTNFTGYANFNCAQFNRDANFFHAKFGEYVDFYCVEFKASAILNADMKPHHAYLFTSPLGYDPITQYEIMSKDIDEIWMRLPIGQILYNPPPEMQLGVTERVEVRISKKINKTIEEGLKGWKTPIIERLKISDQMEVQLIGENFKITPLFIKGPKAIVGDYTQWEWDVKPNKTGIQTLKLCVEVFIELPDWAGKFIPLSSLAKDIKVNVSPGYMIKNFIETHWQWIIEGLFGSGIILFLIKEFILNSS